jgi:signal transduction histidine kinase
MKELDYKKYKILFVDDELNNLENMIFSFGLDFNLVTASSGEQALSILEEEEIAVVVADQRMPNMSGVELLSRMKITNPKIVRMLITAYADIEASIQAINKGDVYRYIRKDLAMEDIETIIRQAIEYYQMKEDLEAATVYLIKSEKLVAIAEMAAGIGHEIKNTITGTNLGLDRVITELREKGSMDANIDNLLVKTKEYGKRSAEIVERLNDFSKPGQIEDLNLYDVVNNAIEMAGDGLKKLLNGIEIINQLDSDIPIVEGNSAHFEMIFLNLIRNACQAMHGTGGKITINGWCDDDWVHIVVQDTGPGIAKENLKRVFGAFYTTKKEGMGMGLYIIDNVVKTFGGRLELESELGKGSVFTVVLPVKVTSQVKC